MLERTQCFIVCFSVLISSVFKWVFQRYTISLCMSKIASLYRKKEKVMWADYTPNVSPMYIHAICHVSVSIHGRSLQNLRALRSVYEDGIIKYSFSVFHCFGFFFHGHTIILKNFPFKIVQEKNVNVLEKITYQALPFLYNFSLDGLMCAHFTGSCHF